MRDGEVAKITRSKSMILFGLLKGTTMLLAKLFCKFALPNINMTSGGILSGRATKRSAPKIVPLKIQSFQIWMLEHLCCPILSTVSYQNCPFRLESLSIYFAQFFVPFPYQNCPFRLGGLSISVARFFVPISYQNCPFRLERLSPFRLGGLSIYIAQFLVPTPIKIAPSD